MSTGLLIAIIGALLSTIVAGLGSAIGVQMAGKAATGVVSERPELFGKLLILQALPGTQGIYGFLVSVLVFVELDFLSGSPELALETAKGWAFFGACMPIAIIGLLSALYQARMAVYSIQMTAKQPDAAAKGMTMTVLVETYAILALLVSILLVTNII